MAYDWNGEADKDFDRPKCPNGVHQLRIVSLNFNDKNGNPFTTQAGDVKFWATFEDTQRRQCSDNYVCTEKAFWKMARIIRAAKPDLLAAFKVKGIEPKNFEEEQFAKNTLIGLSFEARVEWKKADNGKDYCDIVPQRPAPFAGAPEAPRPPAPAKPAAKKPVNPDEIPY